jgi:hypothetical protein
MRKHPNASLLLQPLRSGCRYLLRGGGGELKRYRQWMQRFPHALPRGPMSQLDAAYKELKQDVVRPPPREHPANIWITDKTWKIVDTPRCCIGRGCSPKLLRAHSGTKLRLG